MVNFGFAFLLVFVFATIPAGIYGESPSAQPKHSRPSHLRDANPVIHGRCWSAERPAVPLSPAAKKVYGLSLANVDWLHGGAESLLTITNIIIVLGLRQKLEQLANEKKEGGDEAPK